jgi:UDP-glucose 4-epimerase
MRVWVSGAAGKLGSEVVRQLRASGHQVVAVDRRGDDVDLVDLEDPGQVAASLAGCEAIIHCAAIPSPADVQPAHLVRNNTMSTFNALEEAWQAGIRTAVLASSGSIYGTAWSPEPISQPYVPVDEDSPLQYVDPYALTKDFLEATGRMYARRGMIITALRFHWILTEDEVRDLAQQIPVADETKNLWGYVDLADAARACIAAVHRAETEDRYAVLVIASDQTRVHEPIEDLLATYCPDTEQRVRLTGRTGAYDCSRAEQTIGWRPESDWRGDARSAS